MVAHPVLIAGGLKVLAEDLPHSRAATLFIALALYGGALILAPRLAQSGAPRQAEAPVLIDGVGVTGHEPVEKDSGSRTLTRDVAVARLRSASTNRRGAGSSGLRQVHHVCERWPPWRCPEGTAIGLGAKTSAKGSRY